MMIQNVKNEGSCQNNKSFVMFSPLRKSRFEWGGLNLCLYFRSKVVLKLFKKLMVTLVAIIVL